MNIKKYIENIRNFSLLQTVLKRKEKMLKNELKINNELISYYRDKIKTYKNIILDSEERIEKFIKENIKINTNIYNIKKAKDI